MSVMQPEMTPDVDEVAARGAKRALTASLLFSGVRCILMYAIIPFVLPLLGVTGLFAAQVDIVINLIAIAAIIYSVRRFWKIDYKGKLAYTGIAAVAFVLLIAFIALDLRELGILHFVG